MVRKFKAKEKHQTISLDINCAITRNMRLKSVQLITMFQFFFNWGPLHARLNNHYKAWSLKEKKHKKDQSIQETSLKGTCSQ